MDDTDDELEKFSVDEFNSDEQLDQFSFYFNNFCVIELFFLLVIFRYVNVNV